MSINRVILLGRVGDYGCKISWKENGKPELTFTLLVEELRDGKTYKTFVPIQCIGPKAEDLAETLEPHDLVLIGGKLAFKPGQTKDSGKLVVVCFDAERLTPARAIGSAH
jgi:single-stranded DNA-binding protein